MFVRSALSPPMRMVMTGTGRRTLPSVNLGTFGRGGGNINGGFLLQSHGLRPSTIAAALLTTQSSGSASHRAASSLRSWSPKTNAVAPFPPGLALFSTGAGGGKGGGRMGMIGGMLGAGALLLGKGKYVLGALKVVKLAPLASMVLSVGAYSMIFGLPYAIGMVGLIFIHETGHLLVMLHYKMPFSPMVFIPFMGAVIATKELPKDAWQDALIGFGGPALGTAGAMGVALAAQATDSQLLYALADFGYMVNAFNLIPIGDMDGGRIMGALSPWFGVAGLAGGAGLIYAGQVHNPLFFLIMLAGGWSTFQRFYDPLGHRPPHYYRITNAQRMILGGSYAGLIAAILMGMSMNQVNKKSPEEIQRYRELSFDERF